MSYLVEYARRGGVVDVTMNAPEKLNAIDLSMARALLNVLTKLSEDESVHVIVLQGAGNAFSAGGDLHYLETALANHTLDMAGLASVLGDIAITMRTMRPLIVAKVSRVAAGAGLGLALLADYCLASEKAHFIPGFATVGLASDTAVAYVLTKTLGHMRATQILIDDVPLSTQRAYDLGLISDVCSDETLTSRVNEVARRIENGPSGVYTAMKQQIWASTYHDLEPYLNAEARIQDGRSRSSEFAMRLRAWSQDREN